MKTPTTRKNLFLSPAFLSITIGVPFCVFKYLFGVLTLRQGDFSQHHLMWFLGWIVVVWAGADLILNMVRSLMTLLGRETAIQFCLIAQTGVFFKRPTLFLALDTLLSFVIICFVLWSGWIGWLKPHESYLWYAATTINLISLAVVNIWTEYCRNSDSAWEERDKAHQE
jgi:hypothetical protein